MNIFYNPPVCVRDSAQNRQTPFMGSKHTVAIFLPAVLQTYTLLLCPPFSWLRHSLHVSLNLDLNFCQGR